MHANPSYTLKEEKDQQSQCFEIWEYTQKYAEWEFLFFCFFKSGTSCRVGFSPHILEPVFSALIFRFTVGQLIILKISSCCPCLVGCAYVTVECSKWVELQTSSVAQSLFLILSYSRKSDLVVSEVQMILVSHSLWNLSFYHDTPLPPQNLRSFFPFLSTPLATCAILLISFSNLWLPFAVLSFSVLPPVLSFFAHSSSFPYLSIPPSIPRQSPLTLPALRAYFLFEWLSPSTRRYDYSASPLSTGHVDAGKSTLMGHLLYLLGNVNKRTMHKYEQESKKAGKASFAYAWVLDETGEERDRYILTMKVRTKWKMRAQLLHNNQQIYICRENVHLLFLRTYFYYITLYLLLQKMFAYICIPSWG